MIRLYIAMFGVGVIGICVSATGTTSRSAILAETQNLVGGACFSEGHDASCSDEGGDLTCEENECQCKVKWLDVPVPVWGSWGSTGCNTYELDEDGSDYEIDWRCPQGTEISVDHDLTFEECGEDAEGEAENTAGNHPEHVCYKMQGCARACTESSDGYAYCNAETGPKTDGATEDPEKCGGSDPDCPESEE